MRLTKKGHACVRLEKDGRTLVIDPGTFSEEDAAVGAEAILVTHEHLDHFNEDRLRVALEANPEARIWTLGSVADKISAAFPGRVHTVGEGDTFSAAGFDIQVHGQLHAVIHPDLPRITNVGYLVDGSVFHPGDALTVPDSPVETLLLPVQAPWSKISEVIDYVREIKPQRAIDVHDGLLTDIGLMVYNNGLGPSGPGIGGAEHGRLRAGRQPRPELTSRCQRRAVHSRACASPHGTSTRSPPACPGCWPGWRAATPTCCASRRPSAPRSSSPSTSCAPSATRRPSTPPAAGTAWRCCPAWAWRTW